MMVSRPGRVASAGIVRRWALAALLMLPAAAGWTAPSRPDPDVLLIEVYKDLAANRLRDAMSKADVLVQAYPNFHLGHLIRGDLLLMQTRPVTSFGAAAGGSPDKLKDLQLEAMARLKSLRERPDPDLVPRPILQLRADQKNVLVVDTKRSRLYLYENHAGQLKLVKDYYVSQGKSGVNKIREGDGKTPLGIYYITGRLAGARLPDFYGAGALPISYPNGWDKMQGRGGSGIWLHGTPSDSFSRPPLASDGCVVLTNQDLNQLYASVEIRKTPVIISDGVEFVSKSSLAADRALAATLVEAWRRDVGQAGPMRAHYSAQFKSEEGENLDTWLGRQQRLLGGAPNNSLALRDVSFFYYPGQNNLIVGTFTQDALIGKTRHSIRKRQYWAKEGAQWKIVSEASWQS